MDCVCSKFYDFSIGESTDPTDATITPAASAPADVLSTSDGDQKNNGASLSASLSESPAALEKTEGKGKSAAGNVVDHMAYAIHLHYILKHFGGSNDSESGTAISTIDAIKGHIVKAWPEFPSDICKVVGLRGTIVRTLVPLMGAVRHQLTLPTHTIPYNNLYCFLKALNRESPQKQGHYLLELFEPEAQTPSTCAYIGFRTNRENVVTFNVQDRTYRDTAGADVDDFGLVNLFRDKITKEMKGRFKNCTEFRVVQVEFNPLENCES